MIRDTWITYHSSRLPIQVDDERRPTNHHGIAADQLSPAPPLDLAVHSHLALLNQLLGLPACLDDALPFEELVELDELA